MKNDCDIIIVLSHVGYNGLDDEGNRHVIPEGGDVEIAEFMATLGKPAIVIGGHSHSKLNNDKLESTSIVDGVPIFRQGGNGGNKVG